MTQENLASASGVHRVAIAQIETGIRGKSTTWDTIQKLSVALGITGELLTGSMPDEASIGKGNEKPKQPAGPASAKPGKGKPPAPKPTGDKKGRTK